MHFSWAPSAAWCRRRRRLSLKPHLCFLLLSLCQFKHCKIPSGVILFVSLFVRSVMDSSLCPGGGVFPAFRSVHAGIGSLALL